MAAPRRIVPGTRYMVTRRCYQRTFRLRPSDETNEIFRYCVAWAAAKTGVAIHAMCVMSNHYHVVLTDVRGALPEFTRELHRTVAKALNAAQGQWESLWSNEHYHSLELASTEDVIDTIGYVAANPTEAGLVAEPGEWPGVMLLPGPDAVAMEVRRPARYFAKDGAFPEAVTLRVMPIIGETCTEVEWFHRVCVAVGNAVARAQGAVVAAGRSFLGREAVIGQSFAKRAESFEPKRGPIPQVRARNRTLLRRLLKTYRVFRFAYREALDAWRDGDRSAVFPFGTWAMRVVHHASVAVGTVAEWLSSPSSDAQPMSPTAGQLCVESAALA